jgi:hypothetical protein
MNVGQRLAKIIVIVLIIKEAEILQDEREVPVHLTLVGIPPAKKFKEFLPARWNKCKLVYMSVGVTYSTCFNRKYTVFIHCDFPSHLFPRGAQSVSFIKGWEDDPVAI